MTKQNTYTFKHLTCNLSYISSSVFGTEFVGIPFVLWWIILLLYVCLGGGGMCACVVVQGLEVVMEIILEQLTFVTFRCFCS